MRQAWQALSAQDRAEATSASLLAAARALWDMARHAYIKPRGVAIRDTEDHQALADELSEMAQRLFDEFEIVVLSSATCMALKYQAYHAAMAKANLEWGEKNPPPALARVVELLDIEQVQQLTLF